MLTIVLFASPRAAAVAQPIHPLAAITSVGALIMAVRVVYQTYAGWDAAIFFGEEVHHPRTKRGPRHTFGGASPS